VWTYSFSSISDMTCSWLATAVESTPAKRRQRAMRKVKESFMLAVGGAVSYIRHTNIMSYVTYIN